MADKQNVIQLVIEGENVTAIRAIDGTETKLKSFQQTAKSSAGEFDKFKSLFTSAIGALGLGIGISELVSFTKEAMVASAELEVLKKNFQGTAEDIELFRKATAGTVNEANLIKLSNQASDLGLSMEDQAKLFYLAEDAGDKYGVSLEESFQKVVLATEGNIKGLKMLGIQKAVFENIVKDLALVHGGEIQNLDAETQKQIRMQAILKATGVTMSDVNNQTADAKDRYEQLGIALEETKVGFGDFIRDSVAGWADMISAVAQGGLTGIGIFMDMNNELDAMYKNMRAIKEMYFEAINLVGSKAELDAKGKSEPQLLKMISETQAKINAMQNVARKEGLDADSKNDLEQQKRKLEVYQSTLDLMNAKDKKAWEKTREEYEKFAEEATFQNSLYGLTEIEKELLRIEKKYFDMRAKFGNKPLFDESETIEKLQMLFLKAKPPEDFIKKQIKELSPKNDLLNYLPGQDELGIWANNFRNQLSEVSADAMLNFALMQGYGEEAFGNLAGAMQDFYAAGGERSRVFFDMYKAFSLAETMISTYRSAASALEPPPVGLGPVWGWALAATVVASGIARAAQIASIQPGSSSGGGSAYSAPQLPSSVANNYNTSNNSNQQAYNITVSINGETIIGNNIPGWVRDTLSPEINKAIRDGLIKPK